MKHSLRIMVLLFTFSFAAWVSAELLPYPTETVNGQLVYQYRVPRSIGLYRISVNFGVTQAEIIQWNPQLQERGLHFDELILIPVKSTSPHETTNPTIIRDTVIIHDTVPTYVVVPVVSIDTAHTNTKEKRELALDSIKSTKIALLLPLQSNNSKRDDSMDRFFDFYEGCLIALHDMQDGEHYDLYVYDIGKNETAINALLKDSTLRNMDAIIGPAYPKQVDLISKIALADSIPTFIPFTNRVKDIEHNPYLYQFNPNEQGEAKAIINYLASHRGSINCVFIDAKESEIPTIVKTIKQEVIARGLSHTIIQLHDLLAGTVGTLLKDNMENIIFFNSEKYSNVQLLLPHVLTGKADKKITIFSQYSWQKEDILLPQIYTSVFAKELPVDHTHYDLIFKKYFKHEHTSDMPRFDLLGYDLMRQLIATLQGKEYYGLQSDIHFQPVRKGGGKINTHVQIIRK